MESAELLFDSTMGGSSHPSTVPPDSHYIEKTLAPSSSESENQSEMKNPGLDSVTIFSHWTSARRSEKPRRSTLGTVALALDEHLVLNCAVLTSQSMKLVDVWREIC